LNNYDSGVPAKSLKDIEKRVAKYPGVCYTEHKGDVVFFIHTTPAVYHGTHIFTNNSSSAAAVADGNGGGAAAAATSTSTTAVPYDVDYSVFMLDIEVPQADGTFKIVHTFDQKGLYHTIYGIGYGKGKHPIPNVIEAAASWLKQNIPGVQDEVTRGTMVSAVPLRTNGPPAQMASVLVESNIAGADIEVDGSFMGSTPSSISVTPGQHTIILKKKGYLEWSRTMNVSGTAVKVSAELEARP
jgi:hypothetical protein